MRTDKQDETSTHFLLLKRTRRKSLKCLLVLEHTIWIVIYRLRQSYSANRYEISHRGRLGYVNVQSEDGTGVFLRSAAIPLNSRLPLLTGCSMLLKTNLR